jgi:hypothetical protein
MAGVLTRLNHSNVAFWSVAKIAQQVRTPAVTVMMTSPILR